MQVWDCRIPEKEFLFKLVIYGMDVCNEVVAGRVAGGNHRT